MKRRNRNGWLRLDLTGKKSNRDGIGCRVRVTSQTNLVQYYTVNTAAGYLSASDKRPLIGLGASRMAKSVEITWPGRRRPALRKYPFRTTLRVKRACRFPLIRFDAVVETGFKPLKN